MHFATALKVCISFILVLATASCVNGCRDGADSTSMQSLVDFGVAPDTAGQRIPMAYEAALKQHEGATYDTLRAAIPDPAYADGLNFDPATAKYFDQVREKLELTGGEIQMLRRNGFVVLDENRRWAFPQVYHQIYNDDLPVLVTTDSALHAVHVTYGRILMQLERAVLKPAIENILVDVHAELARRAKAEPGLSTHWKDIDLYLTVARNLLVGAGGTAEEWKGQIPVRPHFAQDQEVTQTLALVQSLVLQFPDRTPPTVIYGGQRFVDYSQFAPRGHYAADPELRGYFRCMMWLGRADCGWNVLPSSHIPCLSFDADRELRNATLLTMLLDSSDGLTRLATIDGLLSYLVGRGDQLSPAGLDGVRQTVNLAEFTEVYGGRFGALRTALATSGVGEQAIRSQVVISDPNSPDEVIPPAVFQVFGQRFCADSYVLSKLVYDSILYDGKKQKRLMPTGLDVMATFGHDAAVPLLEPELRQWNYAANLLACRAAIAEQPPAHWESSFYNGWLDAIRQTGQNVASEPYAPQAMKTKAWAHKQLQAALGSWSELRHDNLLYAKQSYTAGYMCEYPLGYVEPYPAVYARLRQMTTEAGRRLGMLNVETLLPPAQTENAAKLTAAQSTFLISMADTFAVLETLARKELAAEPFAESEREFLRRTMEMTDRSGGCGIPPKYDGWYYRLLYGSAEEKTKWAPTVADFHTDPNTGMALHAAVGNARMCVIAVDNGQDRAIYVGPVYSYYEFEAPVGNRMTDETWQARLVKDEAPPPPAWTADFQAPRRAQPVRGRRIGS